MEEYIAFDISIEKETDDAQFHPTGERIWHEQVRI